MLISLVTPEDFSEQAERLWEQCTRARVVRVAPALLRYEVTAVLRKKLWRGLLRDDQAERALTTVLGLPVQCLDPRGLHRLAWDLARRLGQPSATTLTTWRLQRCSTAAAGPETSGFTTAYTRPSTGSPGLAMPDPRAVPILRSYPE